MYGVHVEMNALSFIDLKYYTLIFINQTFLSSARGQRSPVLFFNPPASVCLSSHLLEYMYIHVYIFFFLL